LLTVVLAAVAQRIVNVVACVMGTVEAPPEREFWLKLPSELDSLHDCTPCALQKILVRVPRGTRFGTAQMLASAGIVDIVVVATGVIVGATNVFVTGPLPSDGAVMPTWYPAHLQMLSKKEVGIT
jgi:hypothetical protein